MGGWPLRWPAAKRLEVRSGSPSVLGSQAVADVGPNAGERTFWTSEKGVLQTLVRQCPAGSAQKVLSLVRRATAVLAIDFTLGIDPAEVVFQ